MIVVLIASHDELINEGNDILKKIISWIKSQGIEFDFLMSSWRGNVLSLSILHRSFGYASNRVSRVFEGKRQQWNL